MAALVFCGGSGTYVASFCCDECQSVGVKGIAEGLCCEIHHHDHENENLPASDMDAVCDVDEMSCFMSRVLYDWTASTTSIVSPEPAVYDFTMAAIPDGLAVLAPIVDDKMVENSCGPPFLCPRTYLSLLTTLLI